MIQFFELDFKEAPNNGHFSGCDESVKEATESRKALINGFIENATEKNWIIEYKYCIVFNILI